MNNFLLTSASNVSLVLSPLLVAQGIYTRIRTPRLNDATGATEGIITAENPPIRLLVFGESTVAGMGALTHEEALTGQTAKFLSEKTDRTVQWNAIGLSGVTAKRAVNELVPQIKKENVDVVIMAIGVNDTMKLNSPRRWTKDLSCLISAIRERTGDVPVFFSAIPPVEKFPALPQPLRGVLGLRAKVLDRAAQRYLPTLSSVNYVSININGGNELFCEDGFHPSVLLYEKWGEQLAEVTSKLFQ